MGAVFRPRSVNASTFCVYQQRLQPQPLPQPFPQQCRSRTAIMMIQTTLLSSKRLQRQFMVLPPLDFLGWAVALSNIILCRTLSNVKDFLIILSNRGKNKIHTSKGTHPLVWVPHPSVALLKDKRFRPLRRATRATRP